MMRMMEMRMMNDAFDTVRAVFRAQPVAPRLRGILPSFRCRFGDRWGCRCRFGGRRALRHLLELDDYLLEDMGQARDWFIAERRRLGIPTGYRDMGGRHPARSGVRPAQGMRDGFW